MVLSSTPTAKGDDSRLAILFNHLTDAVLLHDLEGNVLEVNDTACRHLGYSRDELLRMGLADLGDPASRAFLGGHLATLREEGRRLFETVHLTRSGERIAVEVHSQVIPFDGREVVLSVVRDIRQRKVSDATPHDSRSGFRPLLEGLESLTHELDQHVLRGESWETLMQFLCRRIVHVLQLPLAWVGKRHVAEDTLVAVAAAGTAEPCLVKLLQANHVGGLPEVTLGPALAALRSGRPQSASTDDPAWERWASVVEGFGIRAGFAIPLIVRGKVEGVYSLYAERPDQFEDPLIRTRLERLSDHLSLTLEMAMDQQRMRLLNDALVAAGNPTFITDREGTIVWANQAFLNLTGYEMGEVLGHNPRLLQSGRQPVEYYQQLWETISAGGVWSCETINRRKDGELYVVQQTITPIRYPQGNISHYISIHEDITAKKINQERIAHLAHHDVLTGLPNRRLLMERLTRAIAMARRNGQGVTLLFLDLDGFKPINDNFGHLAGDRLLQEVGRRLQGLCRESDTVARLGGDEFTILLPGAHTDMEAGAVARKLIQAMGQPFPLDGQRVTIGTSIGIALWPEHAQGPEELIAAADRAMYAAKKAGRGVFRFACGQDPARPHSESEVQEETRSHQAPKAGL